MVETVQYTTNNITPPIVVLSTSPFGLLIQSRPTVDIIEISSSNTDENKILNLVGVKPAMQDLLNLTNRSFKGKRFTADTRIKAHTKENIDFSNIVIYQKLDIEVYIKGQSRVSDLNFNNARLTLKVQQSA